MTSNDIPQIEKSISHPKMMVVFLFFFFTQKADFFLVNRLETPKDIDVAPSQTSKFAS